MRLAVVMALGGLAPVGLAGCATTAAQPVATPAIAGATRCFAGTGETMARRPPNPPGELFTYRAVVMRTTDPGTGAIDELRTREDGDRPAHVDERWSLRPDGDRFVLAIGEAVVPGATARDGGAWEFVGREITIEERLDGETLDTHYQERDGGRALRAERHERLVPIDCADYRARRAELASPRGRVE